MVDPPDPAGAPEWPLEPGSPPGHFAGLAEQYARYRPRYPGEMLDHLCAQAGATGSGDLLDIACGTGELALALAPRFRGVWAVDQEPDMIDMGRRRARQEQRDNVRWLVADAEELAFAAEVFELITIGNAFHRVDRLVLASRGLEWLVPGGSFAVAGSSSVWGSTAEWAPLAREVIDRWSWPEPERQPTGTATQPGLTHEEVLRRAGFDPVTSHEFPTGHHWDMESLLGYLGSTSVVGKIRRAGLGERLDADLRSTLLAYAPDGVLTETINFYYLLARRPDGS